MIHPSASALPLTDDFVTWGVLCVILQHLQENPLIVTAALKSVQVQVVLVKSMVCKCWISYYSALRSITFSYSLCYLSVHREPRGRCVKYITVHRAGKTRNGKTRTLQWVTQTAEGWVLLIPAHLELECSRCVLTENEANFCPCITHLNSIQQILLTLWACRSCSL